MNRMPRHAAALGTVLFGIALALVIAEVALRAVGRRPWRSYAPVTDMPFMHEADAKLGWRNKPGEYDFGLGEKIHVTFWPDGTRATAPRPVEGGVRLALIGDSFTEGWAITDSQTFGWKLQERLPDWSVRNYGSAGYSTAQALLRLQDVLEKPGPRPQVVVYGFSDLHLERNVAKPRWLGALAQVAHQGHPSVPYVEVAGDGTLRFMPPTRYPTWPLHKHSAVVALLEERWLDFVGRKRGPSEIPATDALLVELDRVTKAHGIRLIVAVLALYISGADGYYANFFSKHGITVADCRHPSFLAPEMQVKYYGHPNATIQAHWAWCIESAIRFATPNLAQRPP